MLDGACVPAVRKSPAVTNVCTWGLKLQFPVEGLQDWHYTNFSTFAHSGIAPDDSGGDFRQFATNPWVGRSGRNRHDPSARVR
jgi:hypothetical protein